MVAALVVPPEHDALRAAGADRRRDSRPCERISETALLPILVTLASPLLSMAWMPPAASVVTSAVPPEWISCWPPLLTIVTLANPLLTSWWPPLLIVALIAVPAAMMFWSPR